MNVLFLCGRNKARSPTAQAVFANVPGWEVASAGLSRDAEEVVDLELVQWADAIFVMEPSHKRKLKTKFGRHLKAKAVYSLGIPDDYEAMDPQLIERLKEVVGRIMPEARHADLS